MARNHARILTSIWTDTDFIALSPGAQRMYLLLLSQQNLSHAGLLPLTVKRWANKAASTTVEQVDRWLAELSGTRFVIVDFETEEVLIRSMIRGDEVWKQPQVMAAAAKDAGAVASPRLRYALAVEVARTRLIEGLPDKSARLLDTLAADLPDPSPTPPEPCAQADEQARGKGMVTLVSKDAPTPSPSTAPTPATSATPPRAEATALCMRLADEIERNGSKRPAVTERWRNAARLLLDRDHRDPVEALELLIWSQRDEFWRSNVLSMPTFRDKYDQLRLQRERGTRCSRTSTTDQRVAQAQAVADRFRAAEQREVTA